MGYATQYTLEWKAQAGYLQKRTCSHVNKTGAKFCSDCGKEIGVETLDSRVALEIDANEKMNYSLTTDGHSSGGDAEWYDHNKDMRALSLKLPEVLFTLRGEGEESGDIWAKYFLNGEMQVAKATIVIEEFDPKKLK